MKYIILIIKGFVVGMKRGIVDWLWWNRQVKILRRISRAPTKEEVKRVKQRLKEQKIEDCSIT